MNVLIITNELPPYLNANSNIAYTIANRLHNEYGCSISIMGYDKLPVKDFRDGSTWHSTIKIEALSEYYQVENHCGKNRRKKVFHILKTPITWNLYFERKILKRNAVATAYKHAIKKATKLVPFDVIIAFSAPTEILIAINEIKESPPIISYKLDPWASNYYTHDRERAEAEEALSNAKAAALIVTKPIYLEYLSKGWTETLCKTRVLEFPCLKKQNSQPSRCLTECNFLSDTPIHCVFVGGLYKEIRNPAYTIEMFGKIQASNIIFHMIGGGAGHCFDENDLPPNVIYHGYVPSAKAEEYMQAADILVNIGNSVKNQVPSKLISYISTGKPIVNFIKSPDCPTLDYMNRYPLALNIQESDTAQNWQAAEALLNFCKEHAGQSIGWDRIKDLYHECTPEYVTSKVYDVIKEVVNR